MPKPLASLSLDLDNKWSYLQTHGDSGWETYPSYLELVVPRILDSLRRKDLTITFFIVGQDAALKKNHAALAAISSAGHEIGNHSFSHLPWLHESSEEEINEELSKTEDYLRCVTGQTPIGFRGPGFSHSEATLRVLIRRKYAYDCSTFPTFLGPAARAYYFLKANFNEHQKAERRQLFGQFSQGFQPLAPHFRHFDEGRIMEIPVTTMPIFRIPIHLSYVLYLASYSRALAKLYFRTALMMCHITGTAPSILLHPLDYLSAEDDSELAFFPGMQQSARVKVELVEWVCDELKKRFYVTTMKEHCESVANHGT